VAAANSVTVVASANNASVPDVAVMLVAFVNEIVVFLIVAVPLVWPIVNADAAPKIVAVVAAPNTAREEGFAEENTVAKPDEPLIVVALGKSIVAFLIVPVPDAAPNVNDVAAPKIVAVVAAPNTAKDEGLADEKTVAKPDDPLIVVAFGKSIVAFLIVPVPEVAPIVNDVAEPKIVAVVAAPNTAKEDGLAAEKTVAKADDPLIVVALGNDTVVLLIEAVPVEEPKLKVVAAPNTAKEEGLAVANTDAKADDPLIVVALGNDTVVLLIEAVPVEEPKLKVVAAPNTAKEEGLAVANTEARADEPLIVVAFGNDTVVLLIEAVPVEEPIPKVVAAPKIVAVVAAPNTAKEEGLADEKTVAKPDEPLIVVALGKLIVAFLIVPVPEVAPNVNDVAEAYAVAVVAAPNTAKEEGLADEKTVAKPDEPLIVVALGKSIVAFLIVPVPEVAPIVNDVAEPKIVAVVAAPNTAKDEGLALENTVAKPDDPLIVVALGKSIVAFLIVPVPVVAPNVNDVAAVNALTVVDVLVNILNVVAVDVKSPPFKATSPCMVRLPFVALRRNDVPVPAVFTTWFVVPSPTKFTNNGKRSVSEVSRLAVSWFADVTSVV